MTLRSNGSYIGPRPTGPSNSAASGIWDLRTVYRERAKNNWPGQPIDQYFSNVSLLLHMDGTNGSTTFTDSSATPATITANGSAQISTAQGKFGASLAITGNPDSLSLPDDARFDFAGDFTIEAWFYLSSLPGNFAALIEARSGGFAEQFVCGIRNSSGSAKAEWYTPTATLVSSSTVPIGQWVHIAYARSGSTISVYIDGIKDATEVTTSGSIDAAGGTIYLGRLPFDNLSWSGYLDDIRVTKGVARYTANFTPPTAAFPDA